MDLRQKRLIFVTIGTYKFNRLIKSIDSLIKAGKIIDEVIMQIGNGTYIPKYAKYFRFKPSLEVYYKKADIVIAHGGAGTLFECLNRGKKVIAVSNYELRDNHQEDLLETLSQKGYIIYCKQIDNLIEDISKTQNLKEYTPPECKIHIKINEYLR